MTLAAEGLIRIEGKLVTASSYPEFVERLYGRSNLPEPKNHWAAVEEKDQEAA